MSNDRVKEWIDYLDTLVDIFRDEYAKLSSETREEIPYNLYFVEPCQIEVIEFLKPKYQILIVSHDKERKDRDFTIHVYPELDEKTYVRYIEEEILSDPKWDRKVLFAGKIKLNLRTLLEDFFVMAFRWFKEHAFVNYDKPLIFRSDNAITEHIGAWLIKGDLLKLRLQDIVSEVCKESPYKYCVPVTDIILLKPKGRDAREGYVKYVSIGDYVYVETHDEYENLKKYRVSSYKEAQALAGKPVKDRIRGFASYIYPPVWIDEIPKMSFRQRIWNKFSTDLMILSEKAIETTYNGNVLLVYKDGLIAIGIDDEDKALEELNTILASILINGVLKTVLSIRKHELGNVVIDLQTKSITRFSTLASLRSEAIMSSSFRMSPLLYLRPIISSEVLLDAIKFAEMLSQNNRLHKLSLLLLDAHTHMVNHEYSSAFLLSWLIIEHYLIMLLDEILTDKQVPSKRREYLRKRNIQFILELLNLLSIISDDEYRELKQFKDIRNKIVHEGVAPSPEETQKCLNKSLEILKNLIKRYLENK